MSESMRDMVGEDQVLNVMIVEKKRVMCKRGRAQEKWIIKRRDKTVEKV